MAKHYKTRYEQEQNHMRRTTSLDNNAVIRGYDFSKKLDFGKFIESFASTGFQATELGKAINVVNMMIEDKATIFLSMTGNAVSSGLRDIVAYLVKNKMIDVIITTGSGVEEDVIKSLSDFRLGDFEAPGRSLFEHGVGRIGNIFVPNDRYLHLERFMNDFFNELYGKKKIYSPSEFCKLIGLKLKEDSYLYWAAKNGIPVFCPGLVDGSIGDLLYFFKQKRKDFYIDVTDDHKKLVDFVLQQEKTGAIILGGGIAKHYNLNAQIFREGFDYAVYLTTAYEYDGSDSGGNQEEAKTWAKIKLNAPTAKVRADFTITFPLLVAATFAKK